MPSSTVYILVALTLMSVIISVTFLLAWRTLGRKSHTLSWSVAFLAAAIQWTVTLMRDSFPNFESYWLTVNAFGVVVVTLGLRGHCQRTNSAILPQNLWVFAAIAYAGVIWTTVVDPQIGLGTAILPGVAAITLFLSAIIVVRHREKPRPAEIATAVTMIVFGVAQLAAAVVTFFQGPGGNEILHALYLNIVFMSVPAGYTGIAVFVLFMVTSDLSEDMKELAVTDQLTGLMNRRGFSEQADIAYASSRRTGQPVSVLMTDIDRFKNINDKFGHAAGDTALCHFAEIMIHRRRQEDISARVGGEEFALVLPGADLTEAMRIADELCARIEATPLHLEGTAHRMTASFGVATISEKDTGLTDVIIRADRALYRSKREGRNRVDLESSQMMRASDGALRPVSV
jgi:diguanylate cyclase (GGDEF)-like protein